jgi:hypothetical protein
MKTIRTPFSFEDGSVSAVSNVDTVVKQQIVDYFMTINGERIMNQTYGGNIPLLSFEINDPLILADYTLDVIPEANSHLSFGKVLDVSVVDSEGDTFYESNVATVLVRYAVSPRTISTVKLVVDITFNEESDV